MIDMIVRVERRLQINAHLYFSTSLTRTQRLNNFFKTIVPKLTTGVAHWMPTRGQWRTLEAQWKTYLMRVIGWVGTDHQGELYKRRPEADVLNYIALLRQQYDPTWTQMIKTKRIAKLMHILRHSRRCQDERVPHSRSQR